MVESLNNGQLHGLMRAASLLDGQLVARGSLTVHPIREPPRCSRVNPRGCLQLGSVSAWSPGTAERGMNATISQPEEALLLDPIGRSISIHIYPYLVKLVVVY